MPDFDRIQYGRMIESVEHLRRQLAHTSSQLSALEQRLNEIEGRFRLGKGILVGVMLLAGAAAYGVKEAITGVFGR
jgi:hypothetical protein